MSVPVNLKVERHARSMLYEDPLAIPSFSVLLDMLKQRLFPVLV